MSEKILPPASKPYFPMILANGSDVVLCDYSGSMGCHSGHLHLEQHQGALCGWQKMSHREKGRYIMSIAFFPYRIMRPDNDVYEIGWFDQSFDPLTATLITEARSKILHLRVTCFLADGQPLYAERIEVLWIDPDAQPKIGLLAAQMADPSVAPVSVQSSAKGRVTGSYKLYDITGALGMAVSARGKPVHDVDHPGMVEVRHLKPGDIIDRFVTLQDTTHTDKPENACADTIKNALAKGFDVLHKEHSRVWLDYHANTKVSIPDPELDYNYRLGLYLMRASQHPSGYTVHGTYNVLWGGGSCCSADILFFVRGWATANQIEPAKAVADFYQEGAAATLAREYARQISRDGVNYPWFFNIFGRDLFFSDAVEAKAAGIQKGNIASMASQCFDIYRYFGDVEDVRKRLPLMKEMLDFLIAEILVQDGDHWGTRSLIGTDENIQRVNDCGHLVKLIRALRDYQEGCEALGLPTNPLYASAIKGLSATMRENYRDNVLYPWKGARDPLSNVSYYVENMPEGINSKSILATYGTDWGPWGIIAGNAGRDPGMIWPWSEATTSVAFSTINPKRAYRRLRNALRFTDMHGFFVEKIRPDGFWINIGYSTPHATSVWALNSLFATDNVKRLTVAVGLPDWQDYSFENIRTPSGYAVSLDIQGGRVKKLVIDNCRPYPRQIRLRLLPRGHADHKDETLTFAPGENAIL